MSDLPDWNNDPVLANEDYPSEAELRRVAQWPIYSARDIRNLLGYVQRRWKYSSYFDPIPLGEQEFNVSTAGWSGNEDLMDALEENTIFWATCWVSARRGGHFVFSIPALPEVPDDAG